MTRSSTLSPEGSVRANLLYSKAFQILHAGLPRKASEFEVVKGRRSRSGLEAITLLTPPNLHKRVPHTLHNTLQSLSNGWAIVPPEHIRALHNLLILSNSARYDEEDNISYIDSAYWHPNNQLGIVSTVLLQGGNVIFEKGC